MIHRIAQTIAHVRRVVLGWVSNTGINGVTNEMLKYAVRTRANLTGVSPPRFLQERSQATIPTKQSRLAATIDAVVH